MTQTLPLLALLAATPTPAPSAVAVTVKVHNPLPAARPAETIAITIADLRKHAPGLDPAKLVVLEDGGKPVLSQLVDGDGDDTPDELVFQAALGAKGSKSFSVENGTRGPFRYDDFKVYGRFVRERHDDFAWENDRVAHRMYGTGLETWKKEPLTSSGIDVWVKKVSRLVVNGWYLTDDYHRDNGEGADFYSVGKSRGCGGVAIWAGDKPALSRNFDSSRVLANGPIRLVFELGYPPFEAGSGVKVTETKRITLDAGRNFNRVTSTFKIEGNTPSPMVGVGIAKHPGADLKTDKLWMRTWEPIKDDGGSLGCAVLLPAGAAPAIKQTDLDTFLVAKAGANAGAPFVYYMGSEWSKRPGGAADAGAWTKAVQDEARDLAAPVKVELLVKKK